MKITNRFNKSEIIFDFDCNTIKELVEEALKQEVNLRWADLSGANL